MRTRLMAVIAGFLVMLATAGRPSPVLAVGPVAHWPWRGGPYPCYVHEAPDNGYHLGKGLDFDFQPIPLYAAGPGTVFKTMTGYNGGWGNQVIIQHDGGYYTRYAHLSSISVHEGDGVNIGAPIGVSGNTGRSTGPHLHFEVYKDVIDDVGVLRHTEKRRGWQRPWQPLGCLRAS